MLLGRAQERRVLDTLLDNVRGGQSAVLVLRGEAGVGKSALLQHCARQAAGFRVGRVSGVEAEMELPFAGVHQLCAPFLDRVETLPKPQRDALGVALGLRDGTTPDRFLTALAVLGLLCAVADERPLLCLVDDAQWLDEASGQVLAFVARRLLADAVALVFAVRDPAAAPQLDGLPSLPLAGLGDAQARALLARVIPGRLDDRVRDRLIAETRGNPLALLELPQGISPAHLAGGFRIPEAIDLPRHIEQRYTERIQRLPEATQRLLVLAAAESVGDPALLWRAARQLGLTPAALAPAQDAGLVQIGASVRFRHPLVRSAAYAGAATATRRGVHEALADACDPEADPDRRAWHRALATAAPDEVVAAELERSAGRAQSRGGLAAAAALLERATELTPDPALRADAPCRRGAQAHVRAPGHRAAPPRPGRGGTVERPRSVRAVRLVAGRPPSRRARAVSPPLFLAAARELEPLDPPPPGTRCSTRCPPGSRRSTGAGAASLDVAVAARSAADRSRGARRTSSSALSSSRRRLPAGARSSARGDAFRSTDLPSSDALRQLWLATHAAQASGRRAWESSATGHIALARNAGALSVLPLALSSRIGPAHLLAVSSSPPPSLIEEVDAVTAAIGGGLPPYGELTLRRLAGTRPRRRADPCRPGRAETRGDAWG
jgi:hypothetical protein